MGTGGRRITARTSTPAVTPTDLHNRRDELDQEAGELEQRREEAVEEVHDEPLDVGPVVILRGVTQKG